MYNIILDKNKIFECKASVEGSSEGVSKVRLILEYGDYSIVIPGIAKSDGSVKVPIPKLKGTLKEGIKGIISLEIVVEDTLFTPWTDQYLTEVSKKVEVDFGTKNNAILEEKQVKVEVDFGTIKNLVGSITPANLLASRLRGEGISLQEVTSGTPRAIKEIAKFIKECSLKKDEYNKMLDSLPTLLK